MSDHPVRSTSAIDRPAARALATIPAPHRSVQPMPNPARAVVQFAAPVDRAVVAVPPAQRALQPQSNGHHPDHRSIP